MNSNVGGIDRLLRVILGLVLIGLVATDLIELWGLIGLVPLITGIFGYCPAYSIFGFKTCKRA